MQSGRFDGGKNERFIRDVADCLKELGEPIFIVEEAPPGTDFGLLTVYGLGNMWAMVAYVSKHPPYGEKTESAYCTYEELRYCTDKRIPIIPVQLDDEFPPETGEDDGTNLNRFAFGPALVRLDGRDKPAEKLAREIREAAAKLKRRQAAAQVPKQSDFLNREAAAELKRGQAAEPPEAGSNARVAVPVLKQRDIRDSPDGPTLELDRRHLGNDRMVDVASELSVYPNFKVFNLRENSLGDVGVTSIAKALLTLHEPRDLYLSDNCIGDSGARALAEALPRLPHLTGLGLSGNQIGDDGAKVLAGALPATMVYLNLSKNLLSPSVKQDLQATLCSRVKRLVL